MNKKIPYLLFIFFSTLQAQEFDFSGSVNLQGVVSNKKDSPFWLHSNKRGRIDAASTMAGWANLRAIYQFNRNTSLEIGAGGLYHNGYHEEFLTDEIYLSFRRGWFTGVVGRKQREELYNGLSATNENMLWSLNARPLPGLRLHTNRPVSLWEEVGLGFEASWEDYIMDDDRHVENVRVHHKSFHLLFSRIRNFEIKVGFQHFAQWAGTSPDFGDLPGGIDNYIRIIKGLGMDGSPDDEIVDQENNGLGNHLGSYEIYLSTSIQNYNLQIYWNHIFEDGSGSHFKNTPDGRYGIYLSDRERNKWVNSLIYEFYYTRNQSKGSLTPDGIDNYFHNHLYRSGWSYENRILGVPFVTMGENSEIANNKFIVHHFGLSGRAWERLPYKLLISYRKNYGGKSSDYKPDDILSTYLEALVLQAYVDINIQMGTDFISNDSPNIGAGIRLSRNLF